MDHVTLLHETRALILVVSCLVTPNPNIKTKQPPCVVERNQPGASGRHERNASGIRVRSASPPTVSSLRSIIPRPARANACRGAYQYRADKWPPAYRTGKADSSGIACSAEDVYHKMLTGFAQTEGNTDRLWRLDLSTTAPISRTASPGKAGTKISQVSPWPLSTNNSLSISIPTEYSGYVVHALY